MRTVEPGRSGTGRAAPGTVSGPLLLATVVLVLCVVGLVMVLSSSSVQALREYGSSWVFFRRQVVWLVLGSLALVVTARIDYHLWRRLAAPLLLVAILLLAVVLAPGVGISVNGSTRWLGVGQLRMQPSELAKLALLFFCADLLSRRAPAGDRGWPLRPVLLALGAVALLVMLQPDLGTTLVLACIVMTLLFVGGTPVRTMAGVVGVVGVGAFALGMVEPYRRARILSFLNPWADAGNTGYQVVQSLVGLGTGRLTGVGVGASRAKWGFLPNAHTDFIFAILGEELGLAGSLVVIALFVSFATLGIRVAVRAPDLFGALLAAGITAWVAGQAFVNIGAVVGILPVSGVPLPFVSFGGSSLVILMAAVGILLNVARRAGGPPASTGGFAPGPSRLPR